MNDILKVLISELHNFAGISGVLVSIAGVLTAVSQKWLTDRFIRQKRDEIAKESNRSFTIGRSYSTAESHNVGRSAAIAQSISETRSARGSDDGRVHAGRWNLRETELTLAERSTKIAKDQVRARLAETIEERERQSSNARWARITSRVLTFGQYIIGALLTTSFAQNSLSKTWLSVFGLLVILCSATKQHFHVDENAQASATRAQKLRSLVRFVQDQIVILEARSVDGQDRTDAFITLLNEITSNLSQIETSEPIFGPALSGPIGSAK